MSQAQQSFSILTLVRDQNRSEKIIALFRSHSLNTRVHRVSSEQDLQEHLQDQNWDLLVADNQHPELELGQALKIITQSGMHVPSILYTDDYSEALLEQAYQLPLADIIDQNNPNAFIHAAKREMQNAVQLHKLKGLQEDYESLAARAEKLLSDSDDAIAYIADGIIMQANDRFAEAFAFESAEDLDFSAIIDLVAEDDKERFKSFLKHALQAEGEQGKLQFQAIKNDGTSFSAHLAATASVFDDEPCVQVSLATSDQGQSGAANGVVDHTSELYNRYYLEQQLATVASQASSGSVRACCIIMRIDDSEQWLNDIGIQGVDQLVADLGALVKPSLGSGDVLARLSLDCIALIHLQPAESSLSFSQTQLDAIEQNISELSDRTVQFTCTAAVIPIRQKDSNTLLNKSYLAIDTVRSEESAKNSAGIFEIKAASSRSNNASANEEGFDAEQLQLQYQPVISLLGSSYNNYEAFCLQQSEAGELQPIDALAKAQTDSQLDRHIIIESTKALAINRAEGNNTRLFINLTANALKDDSLPSWINVAIKAANLTSEHIVFQFKEADVRNHLKSAIKNLTALNKSGFALSLTHFGLDAAPFKTLEQIKLQFVKFDASFSDGLSRGQNDELKALIATIKEEHQLETILGEVKNAGALATLYQLGIKFIQGAYLQSPSTEMNYEFTELA